MGKASLTRGPFGWVLKRLGCIPVERSGANDLVQTMTAAFAARRTMILAIAPEGTRSRTAGWKSGFYHIAHSAGVPVILSVLDYGRKTMSLSAVYRPSGRYEDDLQEIKSVYRSAKGLRADRFVLSED
jgi:1-acyl-sn-glycerol-3-phosphate acyltransferase